MNLNVFMPDRDFEAMEFFRALREGEKLYGRTYQAVAHAVQLVDPNYDHAVIRNPQKIEKIVRDVLDYINFKDWWPPQ